jgi:hypothetical protein
MPHIEIIIIRKFFVVFYLCCCVRQTAPIIAVLYTVKVMGLVPDSKCRLTHKV